MKYRYLINLALRNEQGMKNFIKWYFKNLNMGPVEYAIFEKDPKIEYKKGKRNLKEIDETNVEALRRIIHLIEKGYYEQMLKMFKGEDVNYFI